MRSRGFQLAEFSCVVFIPLIRDAPLILGMCVFSVMSGCVTLWTVAHQAPLSTGFPGQEYWSGLPCPPPGDLPDPGIKPSSPVSLALQADSVPLSHQRSPFNLGHDAFPRFRDAFQIHSACVSIGHGEFKTPKSQSLPC